MNEYVKVIQEYSRMTYMNMTRLPEGQLKYPYIVPGSDSYNNTLWDWDSWLTDIAVRQIMLDNHINNSDYLECEKGCVLNYFDHALSDGRIPIVLKGENTKQSLNSVTENIHKPCLAQHSLFIIGQSNGAVEWLYPHKETLCNFVKYYMEHFRHEATGLYFWMDDGAIGVDNDPCTFYRPPKSSASIYLNCLMYKELLAVTKILELMGENATCYQEEADHLKQAIKEHMWDARNGFYYSVDLNLLPVQHKEQQWLHSGAPRHYDCLIQKIDVWSGFLTMWAGIATPEQAERMVRENLLDEGLFWAPYGVRTLSTKEKMYQIVKSGNPSCWQGTVWGISNYMIFKGLVDYGFYNEAKELAERTIVMFGRDIEENGEMHEYYNPDTGEGINNPGFQNWNLLVNNMIAWLEGRETVSEV